LATLTIGLSLSVLAQSDYSVFPGCAGKQELEVEKRAKQLELTARGIRGNFL
jgi:hypothetical protein